MRRSRATWITGAVCTALVSMSPAVAGSHQSTDASPAAKTSEFRLSGDTALWSVAIRPGQTEAFERVMARLQEALKKSADPRRREQADGWTVVRLTEPLYDLYRGAFDRNLSLATGSVALDLSGTGTLAASGASSPTGAR